MEHRHRRKRLRPFGRRAPAHFHCARLPQGCAHHPARRGDGQSGRRERDAHPDGAVPPDPQQDGPDHRAPDAYRRGSGQDRRAG